MSQPNVKKHMIYFEVDGEGYAVDSAELAGVASGCPFVAYPGLPAGVLGLIQWSGKVFPVIDAFAGKAIDLRYSTFLFSGDVLRGPIKEIALAVPGSVRVFFAETIMPPPASASANVTALLIDPEGNEAYQIRISKVVEGLAKIMALSALDRRMGRKSAA